MLLTIFIFIQIIKLAFSNCQDDINCTFCAKNSLSCIQCKEGYALDASFICQQQLLCPYYQQQSADGKQCLFDCSTNQIDFTNSTSEKRQCMLKGLCPQTYQYSTDDQIVDALPGILYQGGQIIPIVQLKYQNSLEFLFSDTLVQFTKITSDMPNDLVKGFKVDGSKELGSLVVVWFQTSRVAVYKSVSGTTAYATLENINPESNQILDAIIQIESNEGFFINLIAKQSSQQLLTYIKISIKTMTQVSVGSLFYGNAFINIIKTSFLNNSLLLGLGINLSNTFVSINLSLNNQNIISKNICAIGLTSAGVPKILFLKSTNEVIYFQSGKILFSNLIECYSQQITDQAGLINVTLDEENRKVFTISNLQIKSYSYENEQGVKSLSELALTLFDNSSLLLNTCTSLGLADSMSPNSLLQLICNSIDKKDVILISYQFSKSQLKFQNLYTSNSSIKSLVYVKPLMTLILQGIQQLNLFLGLTADNLIQSTSSNLGCIYILQSQFEINQSQQKQRIDSIIQSLPNSISFEQKLIYQVTSNLTYNPSFEKLISIKQILIAGTQQANSITINPSSLAQYKFKSFKMIGMNIKVSSSVGNIVVTPFASGNEIVLESLIFTSNVDSSTIIIKDKSQVLIKKVYFHNFTLTNSTLIQFVNCTRVYISDVSIHNITLSDKNSSLFTIIQSTEVTFRNTNVTLSNLNSKPMIAIVQSTAANFNNMLIAGNYFSDKILFGIVFSVSGVDDSKFNNILLLKNLNVQSFRVMSSFTNLLGQFVQNFKTRCTGSQISIKDNLGRYGQQMFVQSSLAQFSNFNCLNNSQMIANGTVYFSEGSVFTQDSVFHLNNAYGGGAVYLNQTLFAQIMNSQFTNNTAIASGGAILCAQSLLQLNSTNIKFNSAVIGGGIRIEKGKLYFVRYDETTTIQQNKASLYGDNIGSRLQSLKFYVNGQLTTQIPEQTFLKEKERLQKESNLTSVNGFEIKNIRSGQNIDLFVQLFDQEGRLFYKDPTVVYPPTIALEIKLFGSIVKSNSLVFTGENVVDDYCFDRKGYCSDKDLVIQGYPGKTLSFVFISNFVEDQSRKQKNRVIQTIQQNSEDLINAQLRYKTDKYKRNLIELSSILGMMTSDLTQTTSFLVYFRDCIKGEILKETNQNDHTTICLPCPYNSYSLITNQTECIKCPDSAQLCENSTIILKSGFWRKNSDVDLIFQCRQDLSSCNEKIDQNQFNQCKEGYNGPLCEGCDLLGSKWGKSYSNNGIGGQCLACKSLSNQNTYIYSILLLTLIYLFFVIMNIIQNIEIHTLAFCVRMLGMVSISKSSMKDVSNDLIKLLIHYLQLYCIINYTSFLLPDLAELNLQYHETLEKSEILSSDCYFLLNQYSNLLQIRILKASLLPFLLWFSIIIIYYILCTVRLMKLKKKYIYSTFIFVIMLFQPDCMMQLLSQVGCKTIGEDFQNLADANIECLYHSNEQQYLFIYSIFALIFWSLIPFIFLFHLYKRKNKIDFIFTKLTFGYLYIEFKDKYYFFEFFRSSIKLMIVFLYILLPYSQLFKLNVVVLIISFYLLVSIKLNPYLRINLLYFDIFTNIILLLIIFQKMILQTIDINSSNFLIQNSYFLINIQKNKTDDYQMMKLLILFTNIGYVIIIASIIIFVKLKKHCQIIEKILIFSKKYFKFLKFLLKNQKVKSVDNSFKVLLKWKFLSKKRKAIISCFFDEQNQKILETFKLRDEKSILLRQSTITKIMDSRMNQELSPKQSIFMKYSETPRKLKDQNDFQTDRYHQDGVKNEIEDQNELFSSGVLSQQLDAEKMVFSDIDTYSNPLSFKFITDKNTQQNSRRLTETQSKFFKQDNSQQ